MDQEKYNLLFQDLITKKHGIYINFEKIESRLQHLRDGKVLKYNDLLTIANDRCWPFSKYWMWPCKKQIDRNLKKSGFDLSGLPQNEEYLIEKLNEIFKNITLVSIILRFVSPKNYAIYSRPPLKILRTERGKNDTEEYLLYLNDMRSLRDSFEIENTSDVDTIVWAIAQEEGEFLTEFKQLLAEQLPENLTLSDLVKYFSHSPLKIAEIYFRKGDFLTAGLRTATAFEKFINDECLRLFGYIPYRDRGEIKYLISRLCVMNKYSLQHKTFERLRLLRNMAIHNSEDFSKENAENFINLLRHIMLTKV